MVNLPQYRFSLTLTHIHTHEALRVLCRPFADLLDDRDVGEEVMVLCGRHGFPQSLITLEVAHQDAQAVHVRMLRCDDLKNGLSNDHTHPNKCAYGGAVHICNMY